MNRNVSEINGSGGRKGPAIRAACPWDAERPNGSLRQLLSEDERGRLAVIASVVRFAKGESIYRAGQRVGVIYNIISGTVKAFSTEVDGSEHIHAFLFADDLLGLSEEGTSTRRRRSRL